MPDSVQFPHYDRKALKPRIVHIGFGAFHRAHQALLTDRVLNRVGGDWGICEVVLFSDDTMINALRQQDHLFHRAGKSRDEQSADCRWCRV
nr:hypothetical protein PJ912_17985 [Pectobacterium colocasium]